MGYKISPIYFYLIKRRLIRKTNKRELKTELKSMITKNIPTHLLPTDHHRNVIINFMAYNGKVSIKKQNIKTYNDFFISHWSTFSFLFKSCSWVDIAFDVYKDNSIKAFEGIETIISGFHQTLPVEIDRFWSVSKNKTALQQLFSK